MRINLSKIVALSLMTSAMFVSCSNETEKVLDSTPKTVGLTLNLPKMSQTRQIGNQTTSNQKVTVSGTVIVKAFAQANGALLNTYTFDASRFFDASGSSITMPLEVNGTATYMTFDGNINEETKTSDVNTRQGDATSSAVGVSGGASIDNTNATCNIPVTPDMARVEIFGSVGTSFTNISDLKINGIYLNNVKQDITSTTLVKSTNQTDPTWTVAYGDKGIKSNLCTLFAGGITGIADKAGVKQADGYNFFPQDFHSAGLVGAAKTKEQAAHYSPHIILNVNYTPKGGTEVTNKWLNVVALKNGDEYFPSFTRGAIYQLNLADLIPIMDQINPPVTDEPDPNAISVAVTVSVADWIITPVKPEV